jgi:hypothetical protein
MCCFWAGAGQGEQRRASWASATCKQVFLRQILGMASSAARAAGAPAAQAGAPAAPAALNADQEVSVRLALWQQVLVGCLYRCWP